MINDVVNLDALITRHFGDILAAYDHLPRLSTRVWSEIGRSVEATAPDDWFVDADVAGDGHSIWITPREWLPATGADDAPFYLDLDERTAPGNEGEESWLGSFTGSGPHGATAAFWVTQDLVSKPMWKKLLKANEGLVHALRDAGFQYDEDDHRRLCVPVVIDREELARAFETDDFSAAMQPVAQALKTVLDAYAQLARLRDLAIEAA